MNPPLLQFNDKGIYCQQADVYLDPWRPVKTPSSHMDILIILDGDIKIILRTTQMFQS